LLNQLVDINKKFLKEGTKIKTAFETLKAKMVVTTGDNYVGAAEPQLREKLGELYVTVASNFTAPSPSQVENMELIKLNFYNSMNEFKALKSKYQISYQKQTEQSSVPFTFKTFNEFVTE
jgi:hypothetical protein